MLSDALFHLMTRPNKFIAVKRDDPSHVIIKGGEVNFLGGICGGTD